MQLQLGSFMDSSLHAPKTQNTDLILISKTPSIVKRFRSVEEEFQLSFAKFDDVELLNSSENQSKAAKCFVIDCIEEKPGTIAGIVQSVKYFSNSAYIVVVVGSKIDVDSLDIIKKSTVNNQKTLTRLTRVGLGQVIAEIIPV